MKPYYLLLASSLLLSACDDGLKVDVPQATEGVSASGEETGPEAEAEAETEPETEAEPEAEAEPEPEFETTPHQAEWMAGKTGIGFRIVVNPPRWSDIENYNTATLVQQISAIPEVAYVIFNLSDAAHGDTYLAPHSVISAINPTATPPSGRDLFSDLAAEFQAAGIKVIAYIGTQGPMMLKHGAAAAYDAAYDEATDTYSSVGMDNWKAWVTAEYGDASDETYKRAFAEVIVDEYAERYGNLIDGWWFDNGAAVMNSPLLKEITREHNPDVYLTFNNGEVGGVSDYTNGHPTPVKHALASDDINLAYMLYPIEASDEGYVPDAEGEPMLGHMFMPLQEKWNSGDIVWTVEKGADWQKRCRNAGCAWTWNVDTDDSASMLRHDTVQHMKDMIEQMSLPNTAPLFSDAEYVLIDFKVDQEYTNSDLILATDADNDPLRFAIIEGPEWLSISETGALSGTPKTTDVGVNEFTVHVSDGRGDIDLAKIIITVDDPDNIDPTNTAPAFSTPKIVFSIRGVVGEEYSGDVSTYATDADDDPLSFLLIDDERWGFDWLSVSETGQLSGTPGASDAGVTLFTAQASDGRGGIATTILRIVVDE